MITHSNLLKITCMIWSQNCHTVHCSYVEVTLFPYSIKLERQQQNAANLDRQGFGVVEGGGGGSGLRIFLQGPLDCMHTQVSKLLHIMVPIWNDSVSLYDDKVCTC